MADDEYEAVGIPLSTATLLRYYMNNEQGIPPRPFGYEDDNSSSSSDDEHFPNLNRLRRHHHNNLVAHNGGAGKFHFLLSNFKMISYIHL